MKKIMIMTLVAGMALAAVSALDNKNADFTTNRKVAPFKTALVNKLVQDNTDINSNVSKMSANVKTLEGLGEKSNFLNFHF